MTTRYPMMCICETEGLREAEALRIEVMERLGLSTSEQLAVGVVLSLGWELNMQAYVEVDQWFGVSVLSDSEVFYIECDIPVDGLCYLWREIANRREFKVERKPVEIVRVLSEKQLAEAETADAAWEACEQDKLLFNRVLSTREVLSNKWGMPDGDVAPLYYGLNELD